MVAQILAERASKTVALSSFSNTRSRSSFPQKRPNESSASRDRVQQLSYFLSTGVDTVRQLGARRIIKRSVDAAESAVYVARQVAPEIQAAASSPSSTSSSSQVYAKALRLLCEQLGSTYVKLGQFIASSPALFDAQLVAEFEQLLDQTVPTPWPYIRTSIINELQGASLYHVFSYVDPKPLGSASVAQVHAAQLKFSGKDVVIKVLKPGVEDALAADLAALSQAARVLEVLSPEVSQSTSLPGIVEDLRSTILEETNFLNEAKNISSFRRYLHTSGMDEVAKAPRVYEELTTEKMLVMERFFGQSITDTMNTLSPQESESVILNTLNVWLGSLSACEAIHADLHSGNVLFCNDARIGFIDFGICAQLQQSTIIASQKLLEAVGELDGETMARALLTIGATSAENIDVNSFAAGTAPFHPNPKIHALLAILETYRITVSVCITRFH